MLRRLTRVAQNGRRRLRSVRYTRRIAEINERLSRERARDLAEDGEAADTGVEDTNRLGRLN